MTSRRWPALVVLSSVAALAIAGGSVAWFAAVSVPQSPTIAAPSAAGLNYGVPRTVDGGWVGTEWLRSDAQSDVWSATRPALEADMDFISRHGLGHVVRIFIGLDQAMAWDPVSGTFRLDSSALRNLREAFDILDEHAIRAVAVIFDQEQVSSRGNFHFEALDGSHPEMRAGYLRALDQFLGLFGSRRTVIGWDLFNEAYNSLGRDGHLPAPPHTDPVSPGYSDQVVHDWLRDLYRTAKQAAPTAMFTASDTTELYWNPDPDLSKYSDVVDFYDIHVYDDHPAYPNWRSLLRKPYIVGEAGASTNGQHYDDQALNSSAVSYLLEHSLAAGVSFVLVQGQAFNRSQDAVTPTGAAVAAFLARSQSRTPETGSPVDEGVAAAIAVVRRIKRLVGT